MIHSLGPAEPAAAPITAPRAYLPEASDANVLAALHAERMNAVRAKFWVDTIVRLAFALGLAASTLAVFFVLIYKFLRWVL